MIKEFKEFITRGSMLDLAVGVIVGGAFTAIVKSFVSNLINPLIGLFVQSSALESLSFTVGKAQFTYGAFLNDVLNFLVTAFVLFLLIKFINTLFVKQKKEEEQKIDENIETLKEIRDLLKKEAK